MLPLPSAISFVDTLAIRMLGVNEAIDLLAQFVEEQVSWSRAIARDQDLYGKRSRHWSTADPIWSILALFAVWCVMITSSLLSHIPPLTESQISTSAHSFDWPDFWIVCLFEVFSLHKAASQQTSDSKARQDPFLQTTGEYSSIIITGVYSRGTNEDREGECVAAARVHDS